VARARSRTSKGITDLLLPQTSSCFNTKSPSKKCFADIAADEETDFSPVRATAPPRARRARTQAKACARSAPRLSFTRRRRLKAHNEARVQIGQLFIKLRSRSLSELTRQFKPPTKSGHAPPTKESRKSSQSVNPNFVLSWQVFQC